MKTSTLEIEKSVGYLLAKAYQYVVGLCREEYLAYGITPSQFIILTVLWKMDGLSQVELSAKTHIDRSTVAGIIDRLERMGLIERRHTPEDRRAHRIILTDRGKSLESDLCAAAERVQDKIEAHMRPDEYKSLGLLLQKLRG